MNKLIAAALLATAGLSGAAQAMTPDTSHLSAAQLAQIESIVTSGDTESEKRAALKRFVR